MRDHVPRSISGERSHTHRDELVTAASHSPLHRFHHHYYLSQPEWASINKQAVITLIIYSAAEADVWLFYIQCACRCTVRGYKISKRFHSALLLYVIICMEPRSQGRLLSHVMPPALPPVHIWTIWKAVAGEQTHVRALGSTIDDFPFSPKCVINSWMQCNGRVALWSTWNDMYFSKGSYYSNPFK